MKEAGFPDPSRLRSAWKYSQFSRYIAPHVDLHVTTYPDAYRRAHASGSDNVVLSQWGASERLLAEPLKSRDCEYDVTFVGSAYGNRLRWIKGLASLGIEVRCFGHGWDGGVLTASDIAQIYRKSRISLNFADSGLQFSGLSLSHSRQIKARTFEVPGAGGFLLTEYAPDLDSYFEPEREIAVFENLTNLAAAIRHYLSTPAERDAIARAGFERTRREHTYATRFPPLLDMALAAAKNRANRGWSLDPTQLDPLFARHRIGAGWRTAKAGLTGLANVAVGPQRGQRAARRAVYEIYWRLRGARTYSCAGLPGRLFYI